MTEPYLGEIRMFAGGFPPLGWALCQGQLLPIDENESLFNLIGTTYGGDGREKFALPDLQGRVPLHQGRAQSQTTYALGESGGAETVRLTRETTPRHNHGFAVTSAIGTQPNPGGNLLANSQGPQPYIQEAADGSLNDQVIGMAGDGKPHNNLQPLLCVGFIISLFGTFPFPPEESE